MQPDFWLERWRTGQIGWHQQAGHAFLPRWWPGLEAHAGVARFRRVFVPLCGASPDMLWLRARGTAVVGVDMSPLALRTFFEDAGLEPAVNRVCLFERWSADAVELLAGDFFDVDADSIGTFDAVYDRAALIALPPALRPRYAERIATLAAPGTRILLVGLEHDAAASGPPFAVPAAEIAALYDDAFAIAPLGAEDVTAESHKLRERGATRVVETAFELVRR